jgi:hypothetical protein
MPVQFLRADSTTPVHAADWAALRRQLDDSIATALSERGLGRTWSYATDVERVAKRNAIYTSDPYALGAGPLRGRALKAEEPLAPVLANNLRPIVALTDTRYAVIPVELRFEGRGAETRAFLRVVVVDARLSRVTWSGDLAVPTGASFGAEQVGAVAQRVADLVIAR